MSDIMYYNRYFDYFTLIADGSWYSNNTLYSDNYADPKGDFNQNKREFLLLKSHLFSKVLRRILKVPPTNSRITN